MNVEKYNRDAQQVLVKAHAIAKEKYASLEPELVLLVMIESKELKPCLDLVKADLPLLKKKLEQVRAGFLTIANKPYTMSTRMLKICAHTEAMAEKFKLGLIDVNHFLLGFASSGDPVAQILADAGVEQARLNEILQQTVGVSGAKSANGKDETNLNKYTIDLTDKARRGLLGPIIGRDAEIRRVIQVLGQKTKNNPVLIGHPGVGRNSVIEGLACRIAEGDVPPSLKNKRILVLDISSILAGATLRGQFEERMKALLNEIKAHRGKMLIFVESIHTMVGSGGEGASDASSLLKPALTRGEVQLLGSTTPDEYRNSIEKDKALERRFQAITIEEPSVDETLQIMRGIRTKFEHHHNVKISDSAIVAAVEMSRRYIASKYLPEKAVGLVDAAASRVRLANEALPHDLDEAMRKHVALKKELEGVKATHGAELPINKERIQALEGRYDVSTKEIKTLEEASAKRVRSDVVSDHEIYEVVADQTGIPVAKMAESERERLLSMEKIIGKRVIGQKEPISALSKAVRRSRAGLADPGRPVGSFLFLGPTGCGKTELAKALSEFLFDSENNVIRFDMSEFGEKHTVSRLLGSPPGYEGAKQGGQLTEAVRKKPYSVVLFDEIEKGHPDIFNILLQILDDGRLTDSQGVLVDFKNTVVIMTSNVGAPHLLKSTEENDGVITDEAKLLVDAELKVKFKPEFLGRIDETMMFHGLTKDNIIEIMGLYLSKVSKMLAPKKMRLELTDTARELVVEKGYEPRFGARPLRKCIQRLIQDSLSEELLQLKFVSGDTIIADRDGDVMKFSKKTVET